MAQPKNQRKGRRSHNPLLDDTIKDELLLAGDRNLAKSREDKKNYAEKLSRELANRFANVLRPVFDGILPDAAGGGQESKVRSAKGYKKLDVNYSTTQLGLGLGVSIKSINFPDGASGRYTKNYTRADGELRAEATDYHDRQPYAVMIAVVFLPLAACDDGKKTNPSSFGQAVQIFRFRAGRTKATDAAMLFERVFIGLYDTSEERFGEVRFFDVMEAPPKQGRPVNRHGQPKKLLTFKEVVDAIVETYDARNNPKFQWEEGGSDEVHLPTGAALPEDDEGA